MERFLSYHIQCNEAFRRLKLPACSAAAGRLVLTSVIILDMEGFSLQRHMTVQVKKFLEKLSRVDQVRAEPGVRGWAGQQQEEEVAASEGGAASCPVASRRLS
jgi:hypothetical protein